MKFKILKYNDVNSTNEKAIELIKKKKYENGFVYALSQKKGKGRYGRRWISKKGNFFGSIFFHLKKNYPCLLYTFDAADERSSVGLGGCRFLIKKDRSLPLSLIHL